MDPTVTSAEGSDAFPRLGGGGVDSLVVFLRERGFSVGLSEAFDAAMLAHHLAQRQPQPDPRRCAEWLGPKLRPIFCKSREDQERFDGLYREWADTSISAFGRFVGGRVESLVVFLRENGFSVGTSEALDATRLVLHLELQQPQPDPQRWAEWLAPKLRPIFCKNREDRTRFDILYREWASDGITKPKIRWRTAAVAIVTIAVILVIALIAALDSPPFSPPTEPVVESPPSPLPSGRPPEPPVPAQTGERFYGFFPAVRYNYELKPWVGGGLLALAAFGIVGLTVLVGVPWLSHSRRVGQPITLDDSSLRKEADRIAPPLAAKVGVRLKRHVHGSAASRDRLQRRPLLNVRRSIDATLRRLGVLELSYRAARVTPSYLLLVDVGHQQDPCCRVFCQWAQRLQRQGIDMDIRLVRYDEMSGTARTVRPASSDWPLNGSHGEPLDRLPTPPVGQRLIVISDGDLLVDKAGRWRNWAVRAHLHRWPDRAVFSPVEPRSWGAREEAIERAEHDADPGFIILPLDEPALGAWADLLVTGRLPDFTHSRPRRYKQLMRTLHELGANNRLLADAFPFEHPADLGDLLAQLKLYLGENAYYWLCACAILPVVRWPLTLLVGEQYLINAGAHDDDVPAFIARYWGRLAGLPWMRRQNIPDWLRLALLDSIPLRIQEELREVITRRFGELRPAAKGQETICLEKPSAPLSLRHPGRAQAGAPVADTLYLGFMAGHTPRQLMLRAPREWSDWLGRLPRQQRPGLWRDCLAALRDRLLWRKGLIYFGASRRAWLVLLLAMLLLGGVIAGLVTVNPAHMPAGLRDTLYTEQAHAIAFPHRGVLAAAFNPEGSRIITAGDDNTTRVWDAQTGSPLREAIPNGDAVWDSVFSPDGRRIVTVGGDNTARLWDATASGPLGKPMGYRKAVGRATFSWDGRGVVTLDEGQSAHLWDAQTGSPLGEPMRHERKVNDAAYSPDGYSLVTASEDKTARLWDAQTGRPLGRAMRHEDAVERAGFSPDGGRVLTASRDKTARLWDAQTGSPLGKPMRHQGEVSHFAFSPDGRRVLTVSGDNTTRLWDAHSGNLVSLLTGHGGEVYDASFSPEGSRVVTASGDRTARLWDAQSGDLIVGPMAHTGPVYGVAFSPNGQRVVTASGDNTARLWDAKSGKPLGVPMTHDDRVRRAVFSPDGSRVVTASDDSTARLWDAETGRPVGVPMRHHGWVTGADFSPDGRRLVTAWHSMAPDSEPGTPDADVQPTARGALLWRVPPKTLGVPQAEIPASRVYVATLFGAILGTWGLLTLALAWRARRRLEALSTAQNNT